jgi:hypothetical protein
LPPAVALGFFVKPLGSITFVPAYMNTSVESFGDVFRLIVDVTNFKKVYPLVLVFVGLLLSLCANFSFIEKHFRTGRLMIKKPLSAINETFFPVFKVLLIFTAVSAVYTVLLVSLTAFAHYLICGRGEPSAAAGVAVTLITLSLFILFLCLTGPVAFMIPMMTIYGHNFSDSLTSAFALVGKSPAAVIWGGFFPFGTVVLTEYILSFFALHAAAAVVISALMYAFIIGYVPVYIMVVMFEVSGLARKDNKRYY